MKLRSIISLIVAAVLILSGIIVCVVASTIADSDGVMLFPEEDGSGNLVYKMDLSGITKISLDSADADITIVGGAKESTIEVINFNANYYKLSESNGSLSFAQVDDFMSMFKFWDNGFSFKGMRYILRYGDDAAGEKSIVVHLADDSDLNLLQISTVNGGVDVSNCDLSAAYTVRSDSGNISIKNVTGATSMNVSGDTTQVLLKDCVTNKLVLGADCPSAEIKNVTVSDSANVIAEDGDIYIENCDIASITADVAEGNIKVSPFDCKEGIFSATTGNITLDLASTDSLASIVSTATGKICVNGKFTDGFSKNAPSPEHSLTVSTEDGDVYITYPDTKE